MTVVIATLNLLNTASSITARIPALRSELARVQPGIFCAQEVLHDGTSGIRSDLVEVLSANGLSRAGLGRATRQSSGNAVFYRADLYELLESGSIEFGSTANVRAFTPDAVFSVLKPLDTDVPVIVAISCHFGWGGDNGAERLAAAKRVESFAAHLTTRYVGALTFVVGDFNDTPNGDTLRYLRGETAVAPGAFYIDAWTWLRPTEIGYTQDPLTEYAVATAASIGIEDTSLFPKRRIDYIMVRGWAYANIGLNPSIEQWGHSDLGYVSDHMGLVLTFSL